MKKLLIIPFIALLSACGSISHTETGVSENQYIYITAENLVGYEISVGTIQDYEIKSSDLMDDPTVVTTSSNTPKQNADVLQIKVLSGSNDIELKNKKGNTIYKNNLYLSVGQSTTINL